ncbi:MAG: amidohydrolase, partial [Bacillota bacterium]|nr:amidohydrolase [Bacillota bacterium]
RAHTDRDTKVIDLGGRTVIPGIVDSHNHILAAGTLLEGVMLFDARNLEDLRAILARRVAENRPGEWIEGGGWIESQFEENRLPTRLDLDPVSPDNPVILDRLFGMSVVNSKALEIAGIDRNTPDPKRGAIDRDPRTGEPTGILRNGAQLLVDSIVADQPVTDRLARCRHLIEITCNEYIRWGITTVVDPGVSPLPMQAYQQTRQAGRLPLRVNMMPAWHGLFSQMGAENLDSRASALGCFTGFGDEWLSLGALKMAIDGGLASKTAMLHEPYLDGSVSRIPLRLELERLEEHFRLAMAHSWSVGIHCCGDLAQDRACEAFERALAATGPQPARHNIIHGYLPTPKALDIMGRLDIGVSLQPGFGWVEGDKYFEVVEQKRVHYFKPLKTYLRHGIKVAANSDMTSAHYNPFLGMYSAVARRTARGRSMGDEERISRVEMIRLFTSNGTWLTGEEDIKGSIEPGKLADLAVLSDDLFTVPEERIRDLTVVMTVIDGRIVHREGI